MKIRGIAGIGAGLVAAAVLALPVSAQEQEAAAEPEAASEAPAAEEEPDVPEARSLDELLELVKQGWSEERKENKAREARFRRNKAEQQQLVVTERPSPNDHDSPSKSTHPSSRAR